MLTLYRPFTSLFRDDFAREFDALFNGFAASAQRPTRAFAPAVDIVEEENAYVLKAEVPGVPANELDVSVHEGVLTLKGERKHEQEENRDGYRRVERSYGSFSRSFVLPEGTAVDGIEAKAENGVLTITVPKVPAPSPRKIEIKGEGLIDKAKKIFAKPSEPAAA